MKNAFQRLSHVIAVVIFHFSNSIFYRILNNYCLAFTDTFRNIKSIHKPKIISILTIRNKLNIRVFPEKKEKKKYFAKRQSYFQLYKGTWTP